MADLKLETSISSVCCYKAAIEILQTYFLKTIAECGSRTLTLVNVCKMKQM